MGVSAVLHDNEVTVDPGRDARCQVVLRNTGAVVDQYLLSVLGDTGGWAKVHPEKINLLPNEETYVDLVFSPPRGHEVLAGAYPFALQVVSREDEAGSVVQEGTVTVTGFTQLDAQLVPKTARGRRKGKSRLAVDNLANYRLSVAVLGTNEDDLHEHRRQLRLNDNGHGAARGPAADLGVVDRGGAHQRRAPAPERVLRSVRPAALRQRVRPR